ncbi:MAG: hypothetical protein ACK41Y_06040 [Paracoccus hibiscisoli]
MDLAAILEKHGWAAVAIFGLVAALGKVWLGWNAERTRANKLADDRLQDVKDMANKYDATLRDNAKTLDAMAQMFRDLRNG